MAKHRILKILLEMRWAETYSGADHAHDGLSS